MKAFISYNTRDYGMASLLRDELNKKSVECWMAPESIPGGDNYAQRIPWAIRNSDVFIVLVSAYSMESYWVQNEIGYAVKCRKTLVPIHLDKSTLTDAFTFMLLSCQVIETGGRITEALPEILKALTAAVNENQKNILTDKKAVKAIVFSLAVSDLELTSRQRIIFAKRFFQFQKPKEIGDACKLSAGEVRKDITGLVKQFSRCPKTRVIVEKLTNGQEVPGVVYKGGLRKFRLTFTSVVEEMVISPKKYKGIM